ncbi:MAG: NAD(P)-binding domain-containing protein [Gemmatimonadota bacterium]|nr:NAD(P)-binding domain-containing protein [Gemmatimonadota bacterium]
MEGRLRIPDAEIAEILSAEEVVESCDRAFRLYGSGEALNPPRKEDVRRTEGADLFRLEMPAEWPGRYRARKVIVERSDVASGRLAGRTAVIELDDVATGRRAELDAEYLTNMRTGAAGALGVRYLAANAEVLAIVGTGRIARALALCADAALVPREIRATSRSAANVAAFAAHVQPRVNARVRSMNAIGDCLAGADAVLTAVPTPRPILGRRDVGDAVHLSVIAGDPRTAQLDPGLLSGREVVADHPEQVLKSGDFLLAGLGGERLVRGGEGRVLTIGDAALGRLEDRRGQGAIAYFTGMAIQDLMAAVQVYERVTGR